VEEKSLQIYELTGSIGYILLVGIGNLSPETERLTPEPAEVVARQISGMRRMGRRDEQGEGTAIDEEK
jgi:hypothetical protein